jgi:putative DNA primase/helicase
MWMIRGYIKYKQRGLTMPAHMKKVVRQYEKDNDLVLQFLEARCETAEDAVVKAKDLYSSFKLWAKSEGAPVLSARKFNSEMERHPDWFERKSVKDGYPVYYGVKMRELL